MARLRPAPPSRASVPRLLDQSAFNRRARDRGGVVVPLVPLLAADLGAASASDEVIDGGPVERARRCRGSTHRLVGDEAAIGRGGSDRDWSDGGAVLVAATAQGAITGFVLGSPTTEDRWLAEARLCWRHDPAALPWSGEAVPPSHRTGGGRGRPTGPIWPRAGVGLPSLAPTIGESGGCGPFWASQWQADDGRRRLTPRDLSPPKDAPVRRRFAGWRQVIERRNDQLAALFPRSFPQATTRRRLRTRLAANLTAFNLGLWLNRRLDRPAFALASRLPC